MTSEIIVKISQYITAELLQSPDRVINPDEPLISVGIIDSFSLMDLALFVEDNFGVRIDDTELNADTFDNLTQLVDLITSRQ